MNGKRDDAGRPTVSPGADGSEPRRRGPSTSPVDVSSFRQIELNHDLIDERGRPLAERLFGPQGEVVPVSTPGIERYF